MPTTYTCDLCKRQLIDAPVLVEVGALTLVLCAEGWCMYSLDTIDPLLLLRGIRAAVDGQLRQRAIDERMRAHLQRGGGR